MEEEDRRVNRLTQVHLETKQPLNGSSSSIYSLNVCLQCFDMVGQQEGHPARKKIWGDGGDGHWLVRI